MVTGWTYILSNGGARSLVATASVLAAAQRPRVALIHVHDGRPNSAARLEYVHRQAEHFTVRQVIELHVSQQTGTHLSPQPTTGHDDAAGAPLLRPRIVMAALSHTIQTQAQRLIWPAQFNGDFALVTAVSEQLVLLRHLIDLEPLVAGQPAPAASLRPTIDTPLIDLTDKQLIELGAQLDVPWHLAWSCILHADHPCRVCPPCRRRHLAFHAAGMIDPLEGGVGVRG